MSSIACVTWSGGSARAGLEQLADDAAAEEEEDNKTQRKKKENSLLMGEPTPPPSHFHPPTVLEGAVIRHEVLDTDALVVLQVLASARGSLRMVRPSYAARMKRTKIKHRLLGGLDSPPPSPHFLPHPTFVFRMERGVKGLGRHQRVFAVADSTILGMHRAVFVMVKLRRATAKEDVSYVYNRRWRYRLGEGSR